MMTAMVTATVEVNVAVATAISVSSAAIMGTNDATDLDVAADAWSNAAKGDKDDDASMMAAIADALVAVPRTSNEDRRLRDDAEVLVMSNLPSLFGVVTVLRSPSRHGTQNDLGEVLIPHLTISWTSAALKSPLLGVRPFGLNNAANAPLLGLVIQPFELGRYKLAALLAR